MYLFSLSDLKCDQKYNAIIWASTLFVCTHLDTTDNTVWCTKWILNAWDSSNCLFSWLFILICSWGAALWPLPRWNGCTCLCVCVDAQSFVSTVCLHARDRGLPGWHQDHLVRAHRAPLRRSSRAGWEWLMGQRSDTLRSSASDPQPDPLLRCHPTQPAQWQHTTHVLSVTYPTYPRCHLPLSPQKALRNSCSGGITKPLWLWYYPPCCAVHTGVFLLEDKDNNWQLDQL